MFHGLGPLLGMTCPPTDAVIYMEALFSPRHEEILWGSTAGRERLRGLIVSYRRLAWHLVEIVYVFRGRERAGQEPCCPNPRPRSAGYKDTETGYAISGWQRRSAGVTRLTEDAGPQPIPQFHQRARRSQISTHKPSMNHRPAPRSRKHSGDIGIPPRPRA